MNSMFCSTASAVPRYQSRERPRPMYGCSRFTPPWLRSRSHGRPTPMWSISERGAYWVRTATSVIPEFTALESAKSMIRYLPPNGTPGLARTCDRIESRSPSPPARTRVRTDCTTRESSHGRRRAQVPGLAPTQAATSQARHPGAERQQTGQHRDAEDRHQRRGALNGPRRTDRDRARDRGALVRVPLAVASPRPMRGRRSWRGSRFEVSADRLSVAGLAGHRTDPQPDPVRPVLGDRVRIAAGSRLAVHQAVRPTLRGIGPFGRPSRVVAHLLDDIEARASTIDDLAARVGRRHDSTEPAAMDVVDRRHGPIQEGDDPGRAAAGGGGHAAEHADVGCHHPWGLLEVDLRHRL